MRSRMFRLWRFGSLAFYKDDGYWAMTLFITGINILLSWSITKASDDQAEDEEDARFSEFLHDPI